ncbi:sporulation integral membrane protein YtvI [Texcoconibacillus texcoconensis]|uniref:Sporulation integral membrane protein YtvI n=1 Tax=Texcoconibacillus texcoconensis TaxID=1095777 RepID=A0A840QLQ4_9BACI|nr:sporulation integral membrane protein YtvI [Texcoconibacillus texcoconensis]MBB5172297.1 sporulation integral membrane protein YtvI [Texcoconibacillus texcoconensis]
MTKAQAWMTVRAAAVAVIAFALFWFIGFLFSMTYPFIIASLLVWMLMPLIKGFRYTLKLPNGIAVFLAILIGIGTLGGVITGLVFLIIYAVDWFSDQLPMWFESASRNIQQFFNETIFPFWENVTIVMASLNPDQRGLIQEGVAQLGSTLGSVVGQFGDSLTQVAAAVPTFLVAFFFVLLGVYFIGKDWRNMGSAIRDSIPPGVLKKMLAFGRTFRYRVFGFMRAQLILMAMVSFIVFIGLSILRIENAATFAIIVGVAEILPYLGSGTILIPWFIYQFISGELTLGIGLAVLYAVTVIARQSLEPKVLSTSMNLHPLGVIISMFAGLQLFGFVGLFVGPFLLVVIVILNDIGVGEDIKSFIRYGFKP